MALVSGKTAIQMFDKAIDTYESQQSMVPLCKSTTPSGADLQNSGNVIWKQVQQSRKLVSGFDMTGQKSGIVQQSYPCILGNPVNDVIEQRADDTRDIQFWMDAIETGSEKQASELNSAIASAIAIQGSMFVRSNLTSGFSFLGTIQKAMNARQLKKSQRHIMLNDAETFTFADDLAARQTVQGRSEKVWADGQIGQNIAQFNVHTGSFLPLITGGANPATTVTGDQSFAPLGGTVADTATGTVTNNDYRNATIVVADSSGYTVGDKVNISNSGTPVKAIGLDTKVSTGEAMTFTIKSIPSALSIIVSPRPIAYDDTALTAQEQACANIDTLILDTATVDRINIDASVQTNLFWDESAVEIMGGTLPAEKFKEFSGMKQLNHKMSNGLTMYMFWDGDIDTLTFQYRSFLWYGITIANPSNCGVAVYYT